MTQTTNLQSRFQVCTGRKIDGKLINPKPAGLAIHVEGQNYYILNLWMFDPQLFYIVKNHESDLRYTVFTRIIENGDAVSFQRPVASASIPEDLKTHLQINFPFPRQAIFMSLFPQR